MKILGIILAVYLLTGCASEMKRGSDKELYTIATVLEVHRDDIGKRIQLTLNQNLLFDFEPDTSRAGDWELIDYDRKTLLLLSETPRLPSNHWGVLLQARGIGSGEIRFRFTPHEDPHNMQQHIFEVSTRR
jgi:hypothetical protein